MFIKEIYIKIICYKYFINILFLLKYIINMYVFDILFGGLYCNFFKNFVLFYKNW